MMLKRHIEADAAATIAVIDVPLSEASRFGIMSTDSNGMITEFEEKPRNPKSTLASMGIYIFTKQALYQYLIDDEKKTDSSNDFGKDIIPAMLLSNERLCAYHFDGYWKDVGTLSSLWEANMDLLGDAPVFDLHDDANKIFYRHAPLSPHFISASADVKNSIIALGCEIHGQVTDSVIFANVTIEEGAEVSGCVVMRSSIIKAGAKVNYSIIANDVILGKNSVIGGKKNLSDDVTLVASDVLIADNSLIKPGERINKDIK